MKKRDEKQLRKEERQITKVTAPEDEDTSWKSANGTPEKLKNEL